MSDTADGINIIMPPKKRIMLADEMIEISFIPARVDLEFQRINEECAAGRMGDFEGLNKMIDLILSICKSNPVITKDWILDNVSFDMITEFFIAAKGKSIPEKNESKSGKN
jgi:hypothetical protein